MKFFKKTLLLTALFMVLFSCFTLPFASASTIDEAVISSQDDRFVPLYTTAPDSTYKGDLNNIDNSMNYQLFYTQTTFLALIAGYLIVFKARCLNKGEKMHRRRINN